MSMHEDVLRNRRELDQRIREVERVIGRIKDPTCLKIELKDGSAIVLSMNVLGRGALDHMLQSALADMKAEQIKIEDRIAKWE